MAIINHIIRWRAWAGAVSSAGDFAGGRTLARLIGAHLVAFERLEAATGNKSADHEEFDARLALVLYLPRNSREAEAKQRYMDRSPPFRDGWCEDCAGFVRAMIRQLCIPQAG